MPLHCQFSFGDLANFSPQFIKKICIFLAEVVLEPGSPNPEDSALPIAPSEPLLEVVVLSIFIYVIDVVNKANLKVFKGRGTSKRSRDNKKGFFAENRQIGGSWVDLNWPPFPPIPPPMCTVVKNYKKRL